MLTNPSYAEFTHIDGKLSLEANKADRALLARLYWFTIEFGLLKQKGETRVYGGGILSSKGRDAFVVKRECVIKFKPVLEGIAQAASGPEAAGQMRPLPIALAPIAAGSVPGTARIEPSSANSPMAA